MSRGRSFGKVLALGCGIALLTALAVAIFWWHFARTTVDGARARQGEALARYREAFLEDQRLAASLPILARRSGNRDAGLVIGPRVGWLAADPKSLEPWRRTLPEDARGLEMDDDLPRKLGKEWLDARPALWAGLDFGWMSGLGGYDFWDLERHAPERDPEIPFRVATPNVSKLFAWAKLRLAKGLREDAPGKAIREVEELARLCATTEDAGVVAMGLGLLRVADKARVRAASSPRAPKDLGKPIGPEGLERLRRAMWGAVAYAELRASTAYDGDWDRIAIGRCAALGHGLATALATRPILAEAYAAEYRRLGRLLASSPECRLERLRRLWSQPDAMDLDAILAEASWPARLAVRWIPGARTRFGEVLLAISEQDWFRLYRQPAESE